MSGLWRFSIGNVVERAARRPVAVSPAVEDSVRAFTKWGDRFSDLPGGWTHLDSGVYVADFDTNLLGSTSPRADAPLGWADLFNMLSGTPGLPANPPELGTFASRSNTYKLYRPGYQDVRVMPGETVTLDCGLYRPAASGATKSKVMVVDLASGSVWSGATWAGSGNADEQATTDTWKDVLLAITAASGRLHPADYRIIVGPEASSYDSSSYVYVSDPALIPEIDLIALVGHSIPLHSTVTLVSGSTTWTLSSLVAPTYSYQDTTPTSLRVWRLSVTVPSGIVTAAPLAGEIWLGRSRDFTACPLLKVTIAFSQPGQIASGGARGRQSIWSDTDAGLRVVTLSFATPTGAYTKFRDELYQGTRGGADRVLLLGDDFDAGLTIFGTLDSTVSFSRAGPTRWDYQTKVQEEPRWSSGSNVSASV